MAYAELFGQKKEEGIALPPFNVATGILDPLYETILWAPLKTQTATQDKKGG